MNLLVKCSDCAHFTKDKVGFGQGIGSCKQYDDYKARKPSDRSLEEAYKRIGNKLFWPGVERKCVKFVKK